jgi:pimeloyl-ACP methyl ester carboxylesterase
MNPRPSRAAFAAASTILIASTALRLFAQSPDPSGHWQGAIELPGTELAIRVDLDRGAGGWSGTIDVPAQGLRAFELGDIVVEGRSVAFTMPGVPGDPGFAGALSEAGDAISGKFTQNEQGMPFSLKRAEKVPERGATPARGVPGEGFAGFWQGSLRVSGFELRLLVDLRGAGGDLTGVMHSLDQGSGEIPVTSVVAGARTLQLEASSIGGVFEGVLDAEGSEVAGTWKQGGQSLPLVLKRLAAAPDLRRPQEPRQPLPYRAEEVEFPNAAAGVDLAGTLTLPPTAGPHPAVVLLSGSGPQDRDESVMGHRPFLVLADHLTRQGIAVLRFDDRGVGGSGGDHGEATNADFVSDALAAVAFLKRRPEIDATKIGLVGHSEGGITAPRAAAQSGDVAFIVLMAGVGVPMEELLLRQSADVLRLAGAGDEAVARQTEVQREVFRVVREGKPRAEAEAQIRTVFAGLAQAFTAEQREALGLSDALVAGQIDMALSPWFAELLDYDPRPALAAVKCPVLAINGSKDVQVAAGPNLAAIADALLEGGNPDVTTREFPGLNHLFQQCQTGAVAEYAAIDETINPAVLAAVSQWLLEKAGLP